MVKGGWLILLLGIGLGSPLWAQEPDLYAGEAVVADESPQARAVGLREILRQVAVKLTGTRSVLEHAAVGEIVEQAASLVQQFRYHRASSPDGGKGEALVLQARFDPEALNRLLRAKGIALWRGRRPRILLWLAEEQGVRRRLLDPSEDPTLVGALHETAAARGMRLDLPLLDLQDQSALSAADLWADYGSAIREASARYPHDLVLVGRLRRLGEGHWSADWSLWKGESATRFTVQGESRVAAVIGGLEAAQERLAAQHRAPGDNAGGTVMVRIEGIDSLPLYGRTLQWLRDAAGQGGVRLRAADGFAIVVALVGEDAEGVLTSLDESPILRQLPRGSEESNNGSGIATIPVARTYVVAGEP